MLHEAHKELQQKKKPRLSESLKTCLKMAFLPSLQFMEFLAEMISIMQVVHAVRKQKTVILWNPTCIQVAMGKKFYYYPCLVDNLLPVCNLICIFSVVWYHTLNA